LFRCRCWWVPIAATFATPSAATILVVNEDALQVCFPETFPNGVQRLSMNFLYHKGSIKEPFPPLNGPSYEEDPIGNFWMVINTAITRSSPFIQIIHNSFLYKQSNHGQRSSSQARPSSSLSHQTPSSINLALLLYGQKVSPNLTSSISYAESSVYTLMK
jgi:hypothetical protein